MARRFRGGSVHKVDSKGRVSVPASFRRVLEEGDDAFVPGGKVDFVLIYGRKGKNCLEGYSIKGIDALDEEIAQMERYSPEREALERAVNTQSVYVQVDENGRMGLKDLRDMIGITDEAFFAGMGDKFQTWVPEEYEADQKRIEDETGGDPFALLHKRRRDE